MLFFNDKFKAIRKKERWTTIALSDRCKVTRQTITSWEKGKIVPSEEKIRLLAFILKVNVNEISDLETNINISDKNLHGIFGTLMSLAKADLTEATRQRDKYIHEIHKIYREQEQLSTILKAILNSMQSIFYVKDAKNRYMIVNESFQKNLSLEDCNIIGKTDLNLFSSFDAKSNSAEDQEVLNSGIPVINREAYIMGSRKRKWGLISKYPIYEKGRIIGVLSNIIDITKQKEMEFIQQLIVNTINKIDVSLGILDLSSNKLLYTAGKGPNIFGNETSVELNKLLEVWLNEIVHPDDREKQKDYLKNPGTMPEKRRYKIIHPQKGIREIEAITSGVTEFLKKEYIVTFSNDITDRYKI